MIIIKSKPRIIENLHDDVIGYFKKMSFNSSAGDSLFQWYTDNIYNYFKGRYSKEEILNILYGEYKKGKASPAISNKSTNLSAPSKTSDSWRYPVSDSSPDAYEASPEIIKRLYSPRQSRLVWGGYKLNKYEQDIINFINTNNHAKMDAIRKKPPFRMITSKLIANAPVQKMLYRKEDILRFQKVGDIVEFDIRSFSASPYNLMGAKFTKNPQMEVLYRVAGLRGINIGAYDDFTNLSIYEDEYLCSGKCKITKIIKKDDKSIIVDAVAI